MKKQKRTILVSLISTLSLITITHSYASDNITLKGFHLPTDLIEKDYTLMSLTPSVEVIEKYIQDNSNQNDQKTREDIAKNIIKVSECFKIDPWILTGLIKKESTFNPNAISPTKAAGLTQFTGIGIAEVNDQLGMRGPKLASAKVIDYFNTQIKECINPSFVNLWDRVAVSPADEEYVNLSKKEIMNDIELAVTYGGVLLKTYLVISDSKSDSKLSQLYFTALKNYNGEPGDAKVKYAKAIFNNLENLYPKKVNFGF